MMKEVASFSFTQSSTLGNSLGIGTVFNTLIIAVIATLYPDTHFEFIVKKNNPKHVSKPSLRHGVLQNILENH